VSKDTERLPATLKSRRFVALDGLRGIAIVLVMLSHGWALWPMTEIDKFPIAGNVFRSGNLAVSVFLVVSGFLLVRGELAAMNRPARRPGEPVRSAIRRTVRVAAPVYLLIAAMFAAAVLDPRPDFDDAMTRATAEHLATFTWNWYLEDNPLKARSDMGHLWYISVFLQVTLVLIALVALLGRRVWLLTGVLAVTLVAVIAWRHHTMAVEGWYRPLLRTTTRMDGMLWGGLLACAEPLLERARRYAAAILAVGATALTCLLFAIGNDPTYLSWPGEAIALSTCALVAGVVLLPDRAASRHAFACAPLVWLGRVSLPLYIWHYPIFWLVAFHTETWSWPARTVLGMGLSLAVAMVMDRVVDRPLLRALETWRWTRRSSVMTTEPAPAQG